MITAVRPYSPQQRQSQNFGQKIPGKFIQGCIDGDAESMNRIMDGFPHRYGLDENLLAIKKMFENSKVKIKINTDPALRQIGECFGIIKD
jgi:hypothetical protein